MMLHIKLLVLLLLPVCLFSQSPATNSGAWETTTKFSDDFTSWTNLTYWHAVDQAWGTDFSFGPAQVTTTTTTIAGVTNTVLELSATYTASPGGGSPYWGKHVASGYIVSNDPVKYGYFEAQCKFDSYGPSYMPAFWLYGKNPTSGDEWVDEIDVEILSHTYTSGTPFEYTTNSHWSRLDPTFTTTNNFSTRSPSPALQLDYHKYGIEWTPDHIVWYYDDVPVSYTCNTYIPDHDVYVEFDLGFNWSDPTNDFTTHNKMYVNYVHGYDLDMTKCTTRDETISTPFNPSGYDYLTRKSITFQNGNSTNLTNTSDNITLRSAGEVIINGDFTVNGAGLTILPTACY